ncbi:MAG TPA: DUF1127 domain-containing protein [Stellaceae bacterium]|jgi:uncharacterized protein YjiS (DUF1127 family)
MRPNFFDFERYVLPYDHCSPCEQLAELVCAIPDMVRRWRGRVRGRADLMRLGPRELRDIGMTQTDVARECAKPFWRA